LQWMEQSTKPVPVRFNDLLDTTLPTGATRRAIDQLLLMKKQGMESKHGPAIPAINAFLDAELLRLEAMVGSQVTIQTSIDSLNELFREMLSGVWRKDK